MWVVNFRLFILFVFRILKEKELANRGENMYLCPVRMAEVSRRRHSCFFSMKKTSVSGGVWCFFSLRRKSKRLAQEDCLKGVGRPQLLRNRVKKDFRELMLRTSSNGCVMTQRVSASKVLEIKTFA